MLTKWVSGGFTPRKVFAGGYKGVWYDPSDTSTLFQDAAGTTPVTAVEQPVGKILDKSGNGNHATQGTTANRPTLSARVNQLVATEQFDSISWSKISTSVTPNNVISPLGTLSADTVIAAAASSGHYVFQSITSLGSSYTHTVDVKYVNNQWVVLRLFDGTSSFFASFDVLNGAVGTKSTSTTSSITNLGNGWYRLSISATLAASASSNVVLALNNIDSASIVTWTPTGVESVAVWGADLRTASNTNPAIPSYQRVNTSTDYDTAGFPLYLAFNGTNSCMVTGSIDFTSTAQMSVFAGVQKKSDANTGMIVELSPSYSTNPGSFYQAAPVGALPNIGSAMHGASGSPSLAYSSYPAPFAFVLFNKFDLAAAIGAQVTGQLNTANLPVDTGPASGGGNFGNYALNIGARSVAATPSLFFNGNLYGLCVVGKTASAGEIAAMEQYLDARTGAY